MADTPAADAPAPKAPEPNAAEIAQRLAAAFPALFAPDAPPRPLKLRIQADIQERQPGAFTKRQLGFFFSRFTTTNAYLKALIAAEQRFDLDGNPAGEVSAEHKAAATEELARRKQVRDARIEAERAKWREQQKAQREESRAARAPQGERPQGDRPAGDRPPRGPRPERGDRRPPQGQRPQGDRPPREPREARGDRPPRNDRPPRQDRPAQAQRPERQERRDRAPREELPPTPRGPEDEARYARAQLLRRFESSPLNKANFCVLNRISEAELDAQLAQAQAERKQR